MMDPIAIERLEGDSGDSARHLGIEGVRWIEGFGLRILD